MLLTLHNLTDLTSFLITMHTGTAFGAYKALKNFLIPLVES
jgi:hypothetical protein